MPVLLWGTTAVALAFLLQVAVWRARLPRRQTRAVLLLFLATTAGVLVALNLAARQGLALPALPRGPHDQAHIALYALALTLGWTITYSAIEADSPSLVLLLAVADAGAAGRSPEELARDGSDEVLVLPRIADLLRDGHARLEDGRYVLTAKGRRFVRVFQLWRGLMGAGKGG